MYLRSCPAFRLLLLILGNRLLGNVPRRLRYFFYATIVYTTIHCSSRGNFARPPQSIFYLTIRKFCTVIIIINNRRRTTEKNQDEGDQEYPKIGQEVPLMVLYLLVTLCLKAPPPSNPLNSLALFCPPLWSLFIHLGRLWGVLLGPNGAALVL